MGLGSHSPAIIEAHLVVGIAAQLLLNVAIQMHQSSICGHIDLHYHTIVSLSCKSIECGPCCGERDRCCVCLGHQTHQGLQVVAACSCDFIHCHADLWALDITSY